MAATIGPLTREIPDDEAGWTMREMLILAVTVLVVTAALTMLVLRTTRTVTALG